MYINFFIDLLPTVAMPNLRCRWLRSVTLHAVLVDALQSFECQSSEAMHRQGPYVTPVTHLVWTSRLIYEGELGRSWDKSGSASLFVCNATLDDTMLPLLRALTTLSSFSLGLVSLWTPLCSCSSYCFHLLAPADDSDTVELDGWRVNGAFEVRRWGAVLGSVLVCEVCRKRGKHPCIKMTI